jgi:hypothetical protein
MNIHLASITGTPQVPRRIIIRCMHRFFLPLTSSLPFLSIFQFISVVLSESTVQVLCIYKKAFEFFCYCESDFQVISMEKVTWSRQWGSLVGCLGAILLVFFFFADHSGQNTSARFILSSFASSLYLLQLAWPKAREREREREREKEREGELEMSESVNEKPNRKMKLWQLRNILLLFYFILLCGGSINIQSIILIFVAIAYVCDDSEPYLRASTD